MKQRPSKVLQPESVRGEGWSVQAAYRPQLLKLPASLEGWSLGAVLGQNPHKSRLEPEKWGSLGHGLADRSYREATPVRGRLIGPINAFQRKGQKEMASVLRGFSLVER